MSGVLDKKELPMRFAVFNETDGIYASPNSFASTKAVDAFIGEFKARSRMRGLLRFGRRPHADHRIALTIEPDPNENTRMMTRTELLALMVAIIEGGSGGEVSLTTTQCVRRAGIMLAEIEKREGAASTTPWWHK
jgi:hypothetical protein